MPSTGALLVDGRVDRAEPKVDERLDDRLLGGKVVVEVRARDVEEMLAGPDEAGGKLAGVAARGGEAMALMGTRIDSVPGLTHQSIFDP